LIASAIMQGLLKPQRTAGIERVRCLYGTGVCGEKIKFLLEESPFEQQRIWDPFDNRGQSRPPYPPGWNIARVKFYVLAGGQVAEDIGAGLPPPPPHPEIRTADKEGWLNTAWVAPNRML
jgi:hypothetical protein